jgi:hypothetical protein
MPVGGLPLLSNGDMYSASSTGPTNATMTSATTAGRVATTCPMSGGKRATCLNWLSAYGNASGVWLLGAACALADRGAW